jgi:putative ABC transport system substrate-binding protein
MSSDCRCVGFRLSAVALVLAVALALGMTARIPVALGQARSALPVIAVLEPGPQARPAGVLSGMKDGLRNLGWIDGATAHFEIRYGDWRPDRMLEMARELVQLKPAVLYTHSTPGVRAAAQATTAIPIVVGLPVNQ